MAPEIGETILKVTGLKTYFPIRAGMLRKVAGQVKAVDGVDLNIRRGETFGLAGESGCGKTTTIRSIVRGVEPIAGEIIFSPVGESYDMLKLRTRRLNKARRNIQYVFQDPYASLDPRMTVMDIVAEPMAIHRTARGRKLRTRVAELLSMVGLNPDCVNRYPHAFSGGQRQRIGIARALALSPKMLLLDEPTSALDVSIQAQVLNLLMDLQQKLGLTYIIVSHDLAVLERFCDRIGVMFLGQIMEIAPAEALFANPLHPYTQALLSAIPVADPTVKVQRRIAGGEPPDPANAPSGCKFRMRCSLADSYCRERRPSLVLVAPGHYVRCHKMVEASASGPADQGADPGAEAPGE